MTPSAWCLARVAALAAMAAMGCDRTVAGGRADGKAVYVEMCARCHGPIGTPDSGQVARLGVKDLTDPELHRRLTDEQIRAQVVDGSKNLKMPAFGAVITGEQLTALVAYVRSLGRHRLPSPRPQ